jgi:hypothetical protein
MFLTKFFVNNESSKNRRSSKPITTINYPVTERENLIPIPPPNQNFAPAAQLTVQFDKDCDSKSASRRGSGDFFKSASRRGSAFDSQRTCDPETGSRITSSVLFEDNRSKLMSGMETPV